MPALIRFIHWIISAIGKQVITDIISSLCHQGICIQETSYFRVIVAALQEVIAAFFIIVVAPVTEGILSQDLFIGLIGRVDREELSPGIIGVAACQAAVFPVIKTCDVSLSIPDHEVAFLRVPFLPVHAPQLAIAVIAVIQGLVTAYFPEQFSSVPVISRLLLYSIRLPDLLSDPVSFAVVSIGDRGTICFCDALKLPSIFPGEGISQIIPVDFLRHHR